MQLQIGMRPKSTIFSPRRPTLAQGEKTYYLGRRSKKWAQKCRKIRRLSTDLRAPLVVCNLIYFPN